MKINFAKVNDSSEHEILPAGTYRCRLESVDEEWTAGGNPKWVLHWIVTTGPYANRAIVDRLYFTERALPRVKILWSAAGIDTDGEIELDSGQIVGMCCMVEVERDEYTDRDGRTRQGVQVTFRGYEAVGEKQPDLSASRPALAPDEVAPDADDDLPF